MQQFDTEFGRLFYCIYTLHKRQLISQERKGRLKDMLISTDDRMSPLLTNLKQYNEQQVHEHLLMIVDSPQDTVLKQESEPSEENQSIKSTRTLRIGKPNQIISSHLIDTFKLAEKSPGPLSMTHWIMVSLYSIESKKDFIIDSTFLKIYDFNKYKNYIMKLIKKKDIFQNINTEYEISAQVQRKLLNGNAQFIIDLAINLELNSYSTVSLAIHLCNYFFHHKCYLQYDRFIVAAASLLLAQKIKDGDPRMRKLLISFHRIMQSIEQTRMANEALMQSLQNKLCIAESRILKVIEYEFDIKLPNDYIEVICKKCVPKKFEEATFHTLKILILDSYRTYAPLVFHSWVILVGTFLVASSQFSYTPYMQPPPQLNMAQITNEEEAYKVWLEHVENELREFDVNKMNNTNSKQPEKTTILKQEDLKDFLLAFNEMLFLNQGPEQQQSQLQPQQTQHQS